MVLCISCSQQESHAVLVRLDQEGRYCQADSTGSYFSGRLPASWDLTHIYLKTGYVWFDDYEAAEKRGHT